MWIHILPTHTPSVKHIWLPPDPTTETHIATNTWHVTWRSCVKGPLKHSKGQNVDTWVMRLILLNDPLVLKKNESIRDQEKGEYENNGLLFLPQDLPTSGVLIYAQTDQTPTCTLYTPSPAPLPLAPNYKLSPESAFSQELSHLLASASPSMQMGWCFSNLYLRQGLFCSHLYMADRFDPTCWWCWGIYFSKTPKDLSRTELTLLQTASSPHFSDLLMII